MAPWRKSSWTLLCVVGEKDLRCLTVTHFGKAGASGNRAIPAPVLSGASLCSRPHPTAQLLCTAEAPPPHGFLGATGGHPGESYPQVQSLTALVTWDSRRGRVGPAGWGVPEAGAGAFPLRSHGDWLHPPSTPHCRPGDVPPTLVPTFNHQLPLEPHQIV